MPPDRKAIAADLEFERVAERRPAHETNLDARSQPHLQKPNRYGVSPGNVMNADRGAHGNIVERDHRKMPKRKGKK